MYNNDKRIAPSGRKHFTHWRWRMRGGRERGYFLVDEHKVHGPFRQMGRNNKVHREKAATKKQFHEILMGLYLLTSYSKQQLSSGRESLRLTDNH